MANGRNHSLWNVHLDLVFILTYFSEDKRNCYDKKNDMQTTRLQIQVVEHFLHTYYNIKKIIISLKIEIEEGS